MKVKSGAKRVIPDRAWNAAKRIVIRHARWRRSCQRRRQAVHVGRATGHRVIAGPFQGTKMTPQISWGNPSPLLLGCYELEIQPVIERVIAAEPTRIVDVGCAEGYYAIGLARRLPAAAVYAFDIDPVARNVCSAIAELNGVADRVFVRGECTHEDLGDLSGPTSFFLLDCEGAELRLLDPELVPGLKHTPILVELHDFIDPSIKLAILQRFEATHEVEIFTSGNRVVPNTPVLAGLKPEFRAMAVAENRPTSPYPMQWAWLDPVDARILPE